MITTDEYTKKAMFKDKSINWGILGTARTARKRMIKPLQETEGNRCLGIASRTKEKAQKAAIEFTIPRYYGSYDELIDDNEIDAVYIPLPNSLHYSWVIRAAEKGKHILCEKPLAYSVSQLEEMIQACKKHNVLLLEAHGYSLHPRYVALSKLLDNNTIGQIKQIQAHFSFPAQKEHAIRFQHELGGGSLLDIGWYGIDFVHQIYNQTPKYIDAIFDMENNVDMEFLGLLRFSENAEAIIRTSFRQERRQTLLLSGNKGNIFVPDAFIPSEDKTHLFVKNREGVEVKEIPNADQYHLLVQEFAKKVMHRGNVDMIYERYQRNTYVLEKFLRLREGGGSNGTYKA